MIYVMIVKTALQNIYLFPFLQYIMDLNLICRFSDISNHNQLISAFCRMPLASILILFCIYRIAILLRYGIARNIIKIHLCILVWSMAFLVGDVLKLVEYEEIKDIRRYQEYPDWTLNVVPRFFSYIDMTTGIIITTLLLLCPYYWIQNILYFLQGVSSNEDNYRFIRRFMTFTWYYLFLTRVILFLGLGSLFLVPYSRVQLVIDIVTLFLGLESILDIIYVLYGRRFLLQNFEKLAITDTKTSNRMWSQTHYLIFICVSRLLHNVVMTILSFFDIKFRDFQFRLCIEYPDSIRFTLRYSIVIFVTHFLAVFIVLLLYSPQRSGSELTIDTATETNTNLEDSFLV